MPVTAQFIASSCSSIVVPHVKDGTVFIPANLIARELLPQLSTPMHHVVSINEHFMNIACLPQPFRAIDSNGIVLNVPPPGKYQIFLYCIEGLRRVSMQVVAPGASVNEFLSATEGIACELLQPLVPDDVRLGTVTCRDGSLVVGVKGERAKFNNTKIGVWFCSSFPLGEALASITRSVLLWHFSLIDSGRPA